MVSKYRVKKQRAREFPRPLSNGGLRRQSVEPFFQPLETLQAIGLTTQLWVERLGLLSGYERAHAIRAFANTADFATEHRIFAGQMEFR